MKEFKVTYFFDQEHYIRRFVHLDSFEQARELVTAERDQYISFIDSRGIYHEFHTGQVRVTQISEYFREKKSS